MTFEFYISPVVTCNKDLNTRKVSILLVVYDKNGEKIWVSKLDCVSNSVSILSIKHVQITFHSIFLHLTNIPIEEANSATRRFKNSVLNNNLIENLQKAPITVRLVNFFEEEEDDDV